MDIQLSFIQSLQDIGIFVNRQQQVYSFNRSDKLFPSIGLVGWYVKFHLQLSIYLCMYLFSQSWHRNDSSLFLKLYFVD